MTTNESLVSNKPTVPPMIGKTAYISSDFRNIPFEDFKTSKTVL